MNPKSELENIKVCVILPICDIGVSRINKSRESNGNSNGSNLIVDYETSIETSCFSKPLISFTINSLERIPWINQILICSTPCRQEQIQEIVAIYSNLSDRIKYLCTSSISKNNHHENTFNRLLKFSLNHLNREDEYNIVIVHDITLPYIEERSIYNLTLEAARHGVSCFSTNEILEYNTLFKLDDNNLEELDNMRILTCPNTYHRSLSSDIGSIDLIKCKIGFKPQAFQFSILRSVFENVSDEELDNDEDCVLLAKKYADVQVKLIQDKRQALILSPKMTQNQDINFLQNVLRIHNWNIELCTSLNKDTLFKINEMINFRNTTDGICLIKFCFDLSDLSDFNITSNSENEGENESEIENIDNEQFILNTDQIKLKNLMLNYVLFMIKVDSINFSTSTPHESIRNALKKNFHLNNVWHASILYNSIDQNTVNLIDYLLSERNESINGQILESL